MPEERSIARGPGARPLSGATLAAAAESAEPLARRWIAELILYRPLERPAMMALTGLAEAAPGLVAQLLRALGSEPELERLLATTATDGISAGTLPQDSGPVALLAALVELEGPAAVVEAVESLRSVLWQALEPAFEPTQRDGARARLAGDLGDRLAHVCAALLAEALSSAHSAPPSGPSARAGAQATDPIVILDERQRAAGEDRAGRLAGRYAPMRAGATPIAVRDTRPASPRAAGGPEGPAAWIESIGARLQRYERDHSPFAVVLLEIHPKLAGESWTDELERSLARELGAIAEGTLTRERLGRYWLLAPGSDRAATGALARQLEQVVAAAAARRGLVVTVLTGTAVCPDDGCQAAALAAHADIGMYAARWEAKAAPGRGGER